MLKEQALLEDSLAKGVITPEQFRQMSAMVEPTINRNPDERFRIVSGFSEIFISIGLILLFNAATGLFTVALSSMGIALVVSGGLAWLCASFFATRQRFLLPSIVSCLYAAGNIGSALLWMQGIKLTGDLENIELWQFLLPLGSTLAILILAVWRFRIPFLMLPIGVLVAIIVTVTANWGADHWSYRVALGACGIAMLSIALRFDLKDPHRVRRSSDFAFWCYVIGSPLTIHPLLITFITNAISMKLEGGLPLAVCLILISGIISFISLLLNRRALILSTLLYVGFSITYLASKVAHTQTAVLVAMLLIGLYVVTLGSAWRSVRKAMMTRMTQRSWFDKLPPF